ncbi:DUF6471 domain-containing protein [Methylocystis sp.]|uniref:DUF6471 domain-containing protein n=1 Tax=Methylocystis sp. TaxID=1911079 RepID=UPI003D14B561
MGFAKTEEEWQARASAFLKAKMKEAEVTYAEMAKRLKKHGLSETEASITMKLKRGTFSAIFLLACITVLGLTGIDLEDI